MMVLWWVPVLLAGAEAGVSANAVFAQAKEAETNAMRSRFLEVIFNPLAWCPAAVRMGARRIAAPAGAKYGSLLRSRHSRPSASGRV